MGSSHLLVYDACVCGVNCNLGQFRGRKSTFHKYILKKQHKCGKISTTCLPPRELALTLSWHTRSTRGRKVHQKCQPSSPSQGKEVLEAEQLPEKGVLKKKKSGHTEMRRTQCCGHVYSSTSTNHPICSDWPSVLTDVLFVCCIG